MASEHGHQLTDGSESHTPHERPQDWGWHHQFNLGRQIMGWFSVLVLGLYLTTTHYNGAGSLAIIIFMVSIAAGLLIDRHRRKTHWRS